MLELAEIARSGRLFQLIQDGPSFLRSPGVIGIALRYDSHLVRLVADQIRTKGDHQEVFDDESSPRDPNSIDFSTLLSAALAAIARDDERDGKASDPKDDEYYLWNYRGVERFWHRATVSRFGRKASPIVVEIAFDPRRFSYKPPDDVNSFFLEKYRLEFRAAPYSMLHYAESGGRFTTMLGGERFGTLGGFLQSIDGRIFGVTAAHVIEQGEHRATPAFSGVPFLLRRSLQRCCVDTRYSPPRKWSAEFGSFKTLSAPEIVDDGQCRVSSNPTTKGLDVALVHFPSISPARLRRVNIAGTGQISQRLDAYFVGARSGLVRVRPSSLSIWHSYQSRFAEQNKFACISDCLEIALEPRPHVMTNVSSEGDSGSWLMSKAKEGLFWLGVLVGGDGDRSGVVPAQRIIDHFIPQFGPLTPMI